jgi:hypothetical protein
MPIAAPIAGARILTSDLAAFYSLLKGVTGSGESITLIYNAAGSVILQPSSDPAANTQLFQIKNNAGTVQSALTSDGNLVLAASGTITASTVLNVSAALAIGTTPAAAGIIRVPNAQIVKARNAAGSGDLALIQSDASNDVIVGESTQPLFLNAVAGNLDIRYATTALGGGAAPTVGTIGGSGPATAGQNSWLQVKINGTASFIPVWR